MNSSASKYHVGTVRKRDGREIEFDRSRVAVAIEKAFRAEMNLADGQPLDSELAGDIERVVEQVGQIVTATDRNQTVTVEQIQDVVEIGLMRQEHFRVARRYILYRTEHARMRAIRGDDRQVDSHEDRQQAEARLHVEIEPDVRVPFDAQRLTRFVNQCEAASLAEVDTDGIVDEVVRGAFDGMTPVDVTRSLVLSARSRIERDPGYDQLAAELQASIIYRQALGKTQFDTDFHATHRDHFEHYVIEGVRAGRLSSDLRSFDLNQIADGLNPARDQKFRYLGLQTIYDRYLTHIEGRRIETPQYFWMRVAMGLALAETANHEERALEFYELLSSLRFTSATPTLFNSGTPHPQLSSCRVRRPRDAA